MIIIGEKYSDILAEPLRNLGFDIKLLPDNPNVAKAESGHADLSAFYDGAGEIWLADYLKGSGFAGEISALGYGIHFCSQAQGSEYPADVLLNVCAAGNAFFYNPKTADKELTAHLIGDLGMKPIPVRQGYTACSTLVIFGDAVITADRGICAAALANGFDALLISSGNISLPGYDYGFIGGSAFALDDKRIAFTGTLKYHPDEAQILSFLTEHEKEAVFLTDLPIFDIGGAMIL